MGTVQKGLALRGDLNQFDGTLAKSRTSSSGGTTTGLAVNDYVDVLQVFGSGDTSNMTDATITTALNTLGSANIALMFAPGTWTITSTITIGANFTVLVPAGCVFDVAVSKTMTVSGIFMRQHATYSSGSGTFTIGGTDLLGTSATTSHYASDTGNADVYVIDVSDNPASYAAGQFYAFLALNANTGASTLNVEGLGAKDIKKYDNDGTLDALVSGDIIANQIVTVRYDGTQFQMYPNKQMPAGMVFTTTDNVYTKTETWKKGADIASAADLSVDIDGNLFDVTGTTAITSIASKGIGTFIFLQFDGALTLTHHVNNLILPDAANITTAAGDIAIFYEYASADWRCVSYMVKASAPYNDTAVVITGGSITGITDLVVADGGTGASTFGDGFVLLGSGTGAITALDITADGAMLVGNGTTDPVAESGATLRTSIGCEAADADILKADTADVLTAGFATTIHDAGTKTTGTFIPDEANGNMQKAVNGGAHTLAPPANDCTMIIQYTNDGSAGTITTSGFTVVDGDTISTTNGDDFFFYITNSETFSILTVKALQ